MIDRTPDDGTSAFIDKVTRIETSWDRLLDFAIDEPAPETSITGYTIAVIGWVLGRSQRIHDVQILHGDDVIASTPVNQIRSDLTAVYPESEQSAQCGFDLTVGLLGLPQECTLVAQALLDDGRPAPFALLHIRRQLMSSFTCPAPWPLLVTSLGRSGSTYLMHLLLRHPELVGVDAYPYEARLAGYWSHACKVLSDPADHKRSAHPDRFHQSTHWVGRNPYSVGSGHLASNWLSSTYLSHIADFYRDCTHDFYRNLASECGKTAKYFVEKSNPGLPSRLLKELHPEAREIFLVRDFRDMLSSILAFNERRGYAAFGRETARTDEEFIAWLGGSAQGMLDDWLERKEASILIRYEDLVLDTETTLTALFEYLGVGHSRALVADVIGAASLPTAELIAHRTSEDAAASIGRHRHDLGDLVEACCHAFGNPLKAFGYDE